MKKLFITFLSFIITINAFGQIVQKSLNGFGEIDAINMILHFKELNSKPIKQSGTAIWLSNKVIEAICNILTTENIDRAKNKLSLADGIRIYFASDLNYDSTTIIIVSTYNTGVLNEETGLTFHNDYFEHSSTDPLFQTLKDYPPMVCTRSTPNGAFLFDPTITATSVKDDPNCDESNKHYRTYSQCYNMVTSFGYFAVNTTGEWFDLDLLLSFAKESANNKHKYDGIRIYFGRHPGNDLTMYPNKDAFLLVTTEAANGGGHSDYFDCSTANSFLQTKNKSSKNLKGNQPSNKSISNLFKNGQDNGELCPDNCNVP